MVSLARPPEGLFEVIKHAIATNANDREADKQEHPSTPPLAQPPVVRSLHLGRARRRGGVLTRCCRTILRVSTVVTGSNFRTRDHGEMTADSLARTRRRLQTSRQINSSKPIKRVNNPKSTPRMNSPQRLRHRLPRRPSPLLSRTRTRRSGASVAACLSPLLAAS
ncbi:hypothetical protein BV20DRAFT_633072 [Pilatotrama ljubarskyi]|nr:hypothetical protein BV20DRAFT_633072 [Pilatotrama ljubarskyi]